jgi:hypothetical protein
VSRRRSISVWLFTIGCFVLNGCAGHSIWTSANASSRGSGEAMTQERMEIIFSDQVDAIMGPPGAIQTQVDGINVYLLSDPTNDRMRIIAPIAMVARLDPRVLGVLLVANFNNTLDARYAISEGVIYATFLHPISSLSPELVSSAFAQVLSLAKTFGSTYSAGEIEYADPKR